MPQTNSPTIAIVAGEHSGANLGANLIKELKLKYPDAKFIGIGDQKMIAAGLKALYPMEKLSVIGIFNVLRRLPEFIKLKNNLVKQLLEHKIDLFIGIDAPDFNLVVEKKIKDYSKKNNLNIKIIHYVSPTIWAWRPKRIFKIAKAVDTVLCIFPFEAKIYHEKNISADYVGHPLADKLKNRTALDKKNNLDKIRDYIQLNQDGILDLENKTIISLLPGSRAGEINSLTQPFLATAQKLYVQNPEFRFIVPIVSQKMFDIWQQNYNNYFAEQKWAECTPADLNSRNNLKNNIVIIKLYGTEQLSSLDVMRASDLTLCASGTTTIEAFLLGVPMVVAYKVSKLNELLFRLLIKVKYLAMPNILSDMMFGKPIVPEFLQSQLTVDNLYHAVLTELKQNKNLSEDWLELQKFLQAGTSKTHEQKVAGVVEELCHLELSYALET